MDWSVPGGGVDRDRADGDPDRQAGGAATRVRELGFRRERWSRSADALASRRADRRRLSSARRPPPSAPTSKDSLKATSAGTVRFAFSPACEYVDLRNWRRPPFGNADTGTDPSVRCVRPSWPHEAGQSSYEQTWAGRLHVEVTTE